MRKVFEEGMRLKWEEEGIMGDFPLCRNRVFMEVPKQSWHCVPYNCSPEKVEDRLGIQ